MIGWRHIAAVVVGLASCGVDDALACSCIRPGPPCDAAWSADVIFAGTVRSIERIDQTNEDGRLYQANRVRFDVDQPLVNIADRKVEMITNPLSSCAYRFQTGKKYLVYATKTATSNLTTSVCSRTRLLSEASDDLRYLTALPKVGTGARVYGRVNEWGRDPADEHGVDYGPVENLVVTVRGDTFLKDLVTDEHGRYELTGVPLGKVSISLAPPFGFGAERADDRYVRDLRGCVEANFTIAAKAEAAGLVIDASGRPLPGVMVDAVAAELAAYQPKALQYPAKTDDRGIFKFEHLPPGTYVFGVNLTKDPGRPPTGSPTFVPGTSDAREAAVIELKAGDSKDVGVLRLVKR
jgi:hypothetical protein